MQETRGDLFATPCHAIALTTNGYVKRNGECVMGRGCAAKAKQYWPNIAFLLGAKIRESGNQVHQLLPFVAGQHTAVYSYPVKPVSGIYNGHNVVSHMRHHYRIGDTVQGWAMQADLQIIAQSAHQLRAAIDQTPFDRVLIPRCGCGAGELQWQDVAPVLHQILDDRFIAITF